MWFILIAGGVALYFAYTTPKSSPQVASPPKPAPGIVPPVAPTPSTQGVGSTQETLPIKVSTETTVLQVADHASVTVAQPYSSAPKMAAPSW